MLQRFISLGLPFLLLTACDGAPLRWEPAVPAERRDEPAASGTLLLSHLDDAPGAPCSASMRTAMLGDSALVATWWAVRPDSTAVLVGKRGVVLREPDGSARVAWERTLAVDTVDRGAHGCARPAPAITFEPKTGYVHVSYALDAPEGTGIFFAHSMDAGRLWHSPVSIVYGPRLGRSAIAARGDTVAIAYEDPNGVDPQVALALSVTAGHIFEEKSIVVSSGTFAASAPTVAIDSMGVTVAWRERQQDRETSMMRRATWVR